jgi:hypothetical protein
MRAACVVFAIASVIPSAALAQARGACEQRPAIGAAAALWMTRAQVDPTLANSGTNGLARTGRLGPQFAVHAFVPVSTRWNVTPEFSGGVSDVEVYRDAAGNYIPDVPAGRLSTQRLTVGVMRRAPAHRSACLYAGFRVGGYRFSYQDVTTISPGVSLTIGGDIPMAPRIVLFVDVDLDIAVTKTESPAIDAAVAGPRPIVGLRYRF